MRACTAVLIEMTYDFDREKSNRDYVGEIEFISQSEWEAEVEDCLSELTTEDGRAILHVVCSGGRKQLHLIFPRTNVLSNAA